MLAGLGRRHHLIGVLVGIAGDIDHIDVRIGINVLQVHRGFNPSTMPCAELVIIQQTRGVNIGNLRHASGVDGVNVGCGSPAVSDNADVNFFHNIRRLKSVSDGTMIELESQVCQNQKL